ncbi:Hsp20/alpha crystallin family protein [Aquimarina agarilytica]|uniref:Hsp20/alpha crystallin family protein n=1 Tax=Aquimarina agarilytica TaxID=1087449 RepID=UPI0002886257|nr:Hsp20/alpha crystallin family protein [Aquimarina agarilytica]
MNKGITLNGHTNTNLLPFTGFGNLVNEVFSNTLSPSFSEHMDLQAPKVNVIENDNEFIIELLATGFNKEAITVDAKENKLIVKAEAEKKSEDNYVRREFWAASFERIFKLPENIDKEAISATYQNGILSITLPKKTNEAIVTSIEIN